MTIEDFKNEFKDYSFSEDKINVLLAALYYIYIAQGGHEGGVLVDDVNEKYNNRDLVLILAQPLILAHPLVLILAHPLG